MDKKAAVVAVHGIGVNGLGIVRSLGRHNVPTYVFGIKGHKNLAAKSRYSSGKIEIEIFDGKIMMQALCDFAEKFQSKPVLLFDNDKMMIEMAPYADELEKYYHLTSPLSTALEVTDKVFQMNAAIEAGVDVPKTWYPKTWEELDQLDAIQGHKVIAKPSPAAYPPEKLPFKIIVGQNLVDLRALLEQVVSTPDGIIVQDFIEGGDDTIYVALCYRSEKNNYSQALSAKKLRQNPAGAGVMAIGQAVDAPIVREMSLNLISHINYSGIVSTEFKHSSEDNKYYFIEFNPRLGQFHTIARRSGFELPYIAYLDHADPAKLESLQHSNDSKHKWIYNTGYIDTLLKGERKENLSDFLTLYKGSVEWAVFSLDDIHPSLIALWDFAINIRRTLVSKIKKRFLG